LIELWHHKRFTRFDSTNEADHEPDRLEDGGMSETYTTTQVATHLHISPRQLQWADEANVLKPKRMPRAAQTGTEGLPALQRTPHALLLALIANLRERGVPLQRLRKHLPAIKSQFKKRLPLYVVLGKDVRFANTSARC
jgi:hypothetical protein